MANVSEVYPGIFRIPLPMPGPLREVHVYLIKGDDGHLLVDGGWEAPENWAALWSGLGEAGVTLAPGAIRRMLITHVHVDHIGMARRVKATFGAEILMHAYEQVFLGPRYAEPQALRTQMNQWLKINGVPQQSIARLRDASLAFTGHEMPGPDVTLNGAEQIDAGPYHFRVLWTPGHSPGHVCLYEPDHELLITGDHILPNQTPNMSLHPQSTPNPLADYLDSLAYIRQLPVKLALPGHGDPFTDVPQRVERTLEHHEKRLSQLRQALRARPLTAWEAAHHVAWSGGRRKFEEFDMWNQRLALLETLAHLEYLRLADRSHKDFHLGQARYYVE